MVPDTHDGTRREVDILLRVPSGGRELLIAIECRDHKRKADLPWIEALHTKHQSLPVDRYVAVSRKGFSSAALAKAWLYKIETLTLEKAETINWAANIGRLRSVEVGSILSETVGDVTILSGTPSGNAPLWSPQAKDIEVRGTGGTLITLGTLAAALLGNHVISNHLTQVSSRTDQLHTLRIRFDPEVLGRDTSGAWHPVRGLTFSVRQTVDVAHVPLSHATYSSAAIATGASLVGNTSVTIALTEAEKGLVRGEAVFAREGETLRVALDPFPSGVEQRER